MSSCFEPAEATPAQGQVKFGGQAEFWKKLAEELGNYGRMLASTGYVHQEGEKLYRDPLEDARHRTAGYVLIGISVSIERSLSARKANTNGGKRKP